MTNELIAQEIIHRIGRDKAAEYGIQSILRQMEAIYFSYNRRFLGAVKDTHTIVFADNETDFTDTLPDDYLQGYAIDPEAKFRHKKVFKDDETGTFTIDQGVIQFVQAAGITFTIKYFSRGKYLVIPDPGQAVPQGYASTPEWPEDFHWLLMLATATRLSNKYDLYQSDVHDRQEYERQLKKQARVAQDATSKIVQGPLVRTSAIEIDAYSPDYTGPFFI